MCNHSFLTTKYIISNEELTYLKSLGISISVLASHEQYLNLTTNYCYWCGKLTNVFYKDILIFNIQSGICL